MIKQLAHLCFMSHQLPAMLAFYRDVLGLKVKFALKHDDGTPFGYYLATGSTTFVEIFDRAGAVKQWGGENLPLRPHDGTLQPFLLRGHRAGGVSRATAGPGRED